MLNPNNKLNPVSEYFGSKYVSFDLIVDFIFKLYLRDNMNR